ncbi:MAG: tRNA (N(6)-L-threonylcarbamoyladenosine(37)-C(2))-methylthiotransferase MtaB [Candidatus Aminicenantales bacterium]
MTSFAIRNFGCRVNQAEAFSWAEDLQARGLALEEDWNRSDYVLINTCTLTGHADRDVQRFVRRVARGNPNARLVVTGCYAERAADEFRGLPGVWLVVPNGEKNSLTDRILGSDAPRAEASAVRSRARGFVKVQDGCDFRCAYCVIPSVRGKSVSVPESDILARVRGLTDRGYREIVLAGIHLCSYGLDSNPKSSFAELLDRVEAVPGIGRIRLGSLDPRFLSGPLVDRMATSPSICPHFHLSLQSGSAKVLREMGRPADPEDYGNVLERLRRNSPDAGLGADIIVGFPGETDEDFERTREFLRNAPLSYFHVFPYSPREGTEAAQRPMVDERVKKERAGILRALSVRMNEAFRRRLLGREFQAVVIGGKGPAPEVLTGNYVRVEVPGCSAARRDLARVRITNVESERTEGAIA